VNVVAGVILDYRGFDTFGESCVLFVAVCAVLALLRKEERDAFDELLHAMEETTHDVILKQVSHIMVPLIALFGIYVVIGGHLSPGGGFSGGAILGAAMILFACSFGTIEARRVFSYVNCRRIMTGALLFYAALKGCAMYAGANGFYTGIPLGTSGTIFSAGLLLPLNIAVGIIVACTMYILYILFSKGEML
jgi:multicomponent Na+:H+ antiporter subunit B